MKNSTWSFVGAFIWTMLATANYVEIVSGNYDVWTILLVLSCLVLVPYSLRRGVVYTIKENS